MPTSSTLQPPTPRAVAEEPPAPAGDPEGARGGDLPAAVTPLTRGEVLERLRTASKRGRLAGFREGSGEDCFVVAAHGHPFDGDLIATCGAAPGGGTRLTFRTRMHRRMPWVFAAILIATVWPGVHFMDGLIPASWGWIPTWWWYMPVTALPLPWVWKGLMQKSRATIRAAAEEAIGRIAGETGGRVQA